MTFGYLFPQNGGDKEHLKKMWNLFLLFCLFIRLHQRLIPERNEGILKMCASSYALAIAKCIRTSSSCTFSTSPKLFCWSRRKGYPFCFLYIFPWFGTIKKILLWNIPLTQLKITLINNATQLKFRFSVMFVIHNRISKTAYFLSLFVFLYNLFLFDFSFFLSCNYNYDYN